MASSNGIERRKWEDPDSGFWYEVEVPSGSPDSALKLGIRIGPPEFDSPPYSRWPLDIRRRLNHELFARGILTYKEARKRRHDLQLAIASVLNIDVDTLLSVYYEETQG